MSIEEQSKIMLSGYGAEKFIRRFFIIVLVWGLVPKTQKCPTMVLRIGLGATCHALPIWGIRRSISKKSPSSLTCSLLKGRCAANSGSPVLNARKDPRR